MSFGYISSKVQHMRRMGLVTKTDGGFGENGGADPDWLVTAQKDEHKRLAKLKERSEERAAADLRRRHARELNPEYAAQREKAYDFA